MSGSGGVSGCGRGSGSGGGEWEIGGGVRGEENRNNESEEGT